jgi:hypothetical protein
MSKLAELRELVGANVYYGWGAPEKDREISEKIEELIYDLDGESVDETFEDGGRWSNYETEVFKVKEGEEVAYFEISREVPATECQDGGDFTMELHEVKPKEVIKTEYWRV